jgi:hypothetical protein
MRPAVAYSQPVHRGGGAEKCYHFTEDLVVPYVAPDTAVEYARLIQRPGRGKHPDQPGVLRIHI